MDLIAVSVIGGLSLGAIYALITLGLVLGYRATDTLNFSHGQFMLLAAYLTGKWQATSDLPFVVIALAALAITGLAGALLYRIVLQRMVGLPHFMPVIATLGFAAVADGAMGILFGAEQFVITVPGLPESFVTILGARFSVESLVLTVFGFLLALGVAGALHYTDLGRRVRAAGQDPLLASQGGIQVHVIYLGSWFVSAALAGVAGIVHASSTVVTPGMVELALLAFPAMLLGGLDSIGGALVGGAIVGLLQGFVAAYLGGEYVNVVTYIALLVVMMFMPEGLYGTKKVSRV